jgi:hypothetical protein
MLNLRQSRSQTLALYKVVAPDTSCIKGFTATILFGITKFWFEKIWMSSKQILNHHILYILNFKIKKHICVTIYCSGKIDWGIPFMQRQSC